MSIHRSPFVLTSVWVAVFRTWLAVCRVLDLERLLWRLVIAFVGADANMISIDNRSRAVSRRRKVNSPGTDFVGTNENHITSPCR